MQQTAQDNKEKRSKTSVACVLGIAKTSYLKRGQSRAQQCTIKGVDGELYSVRLASTSHENLIQNKRYFYVQIHRFRDRQNVKRCNARVIMVTDEIVHFCSEYLKHTKLNLHRSNKHIFIFSYNFYMLEQTISASTDTHSYCCLG